jgi:1-acyl-sn-glycerol-3-phosphate acyltransferase
MKLLRVLYQPYKWLIVIPLVGLSMAFFGTGAIIASYFSKSAACLFWGGNWARFISSITPMLLFIKGRKNIDKTQSYVVVANHQSVYDMIAVFGHLRMDLRWVMKKQLRKVPFLGYSSYRVGNVFVDRSNHEQAVKSVNEAKKVVKDGISMMFFAEGTRSMTGRLQEFKKGAFIMAMDMGLPILPVTLDGTIRILPSTTWNLFPGRASMIIHEPIDTSGYTRDNIDELIAKVKGVIGSGLTERSFVGGEDDQTGNGNQRTPKTRENLHTKSLSL